MRKVYQPLFIFITAFIGSIFSFWYLINQPINKNNFTQLAPYAIIINNGLFFISLFLMLYTFFIKGKSKKIIGSLLIIMGLLYLSLMFSFINVSYYYLLPVGLFIFTGFITIG